jgi:hypothetical protein
MQTCVTVSNADATKTRLDHIFNLFGYYGNVARIKVIWCLFFVCSLFLCSLMFIVLSFFRSFVVVHVSFFLCLFFVLCCLFGCFAVNRLFCTGHCSKEYYSCRLCHSRRSSKRHALHQVRRKRKEKKI